MTDTAAEQAKVLHRLDDSVVIREAQSADIPAIVELLADDPLGAAREASVLDVLPETYTIAFDKIAADPHDLLVVIDLDGSVGGTLQLTLLHGLSRNGATRGQIEAVRVRSDLRGRGFGEALFQWAIDYCRSSGCALVQLTTDKSRHDAHRFYDRLGFENSHEGFKLVLGS